MSLQADPARGARLMESADWDRLTAEVLARGATARLPARGGSMRPFIPDGCIALVEPATANELQVGDIALVSLGGKLVIHRVVRVGRVAGRPAVQTKGDAVCELDSWACGDAVLGRVTALEREGRTLPVGATPRARLLARALALVSLRARRWQGAWLRRKVRRRHHTSA